MRIRYSKVLAAFFPAILLFSNCGNHSQSTQNKDSTNTQNDSKNKTSTSVRYDEILKSQDSLLNTFSWPAKHVIDLNDDGVNEEFLAFEGYSRGMNYIPFSKDGNNWIQLSDNDGIPSGHLGIEKLDKTNGGWHDFLALQPSGRDGIIESHYAWNGKKYILKEQKEVSN